MDNRVLNFRSVIMNKHIHKQYDLSLMNDRICSLDGSLSDSGLTSIQFHVEAFSSIERDLWAFGCHPIGCPERLS